MSTSRTTTRFDAKSRSGTRRADKGLVQRLLVSYLILDRGVEQRQGKRLAFDRIRLRTLPGRRHDQVTELSEILRLPLQLGRAQPQLSADLLVARLVDPVARVEEQRD